MKETGLELEQRRYYVTRRFVLFDRKKIRDTGTYYPRLLLDLSNADGWGFEVDNRHNQAMTVELIGGSGGSPASAGLVGVSATIASSTKEPVATNIWLPWLGIRVTYSASPTEGDLEITGWVQEVRR